jgi:hypothetical protein
MTRVHHDPVLPYILQNCPAIEYIVGGAQLWPYGKALSSRIVLFQKWEKLMMGIESMIYITCQVTALPLSYFDDFDICNYKFDSGVTVLVIWGQLYRAQVIKLLTILDKIIRLWIYVPVKVMFDCCEMVLNKTFYFIK